MESVYDWAIFPDKKTTQIRQGLSMCEKIIKQIVVKQLKKEFPHWRSLAKKEKKAIASRVLAEAYAKFNSGETADFGGNELTNTSTPSPGIISLEQMGSFIAETTRSLLKFPRGHWQKHLDDGELREIDRLLDDRVLNRLLAPEGFTPSMRTIFPSHCFRAELLKALRYGEISYRKFCREVINRQTNKRDRAFLHLPLHRHIEIDHTELSHFRTGLSVVQLINVMVYVAHLLVQRGKIAHPYHVCGIDSTDLAVVSRPHPLATLKLPNNKSVRIYAELDADCGKRRKKRDKSEYFVGYRIHTLVAIDAKTGANYPLLNLVAPANHHDKLFLPQLLAFASAMGLRMEIVTADEGYLDPKQNEQMHQEYGVRVITPASQKVNVPDHIDGNTGAVFMNGRCEVPMAYLGKTSFGHEFGCATQECFHAPSCPQWREIPLDGGLFGQIPDQIPGVDKARKIRKHMERWYNLAKHREGLEPLRVKSQHSALTAVTFAQLAALLLEIVGTRKTKKQEELPRQLRMAS